MHIIGHETMPLIDDDRYFDTSRLLKAFYKPFDVLTLVVLMIGFVLLTPFRRLANALHSILQIRGSKVFLCF